MKQIINIIWKLWNNPDLRLLVGDILEVYADLVKEETDSNQALERIVDLVRDFIFGDA